jgi:hypothetical protein
VKVEDDGHFYIISASSASGFLPLHQDMGTIANSRNSLAFFFNHYCHLRFLSMPESFIIIAVLVLLLLKLPIVVEMMWKAPISS